MFADKVAESAKRAGIADGYTGIDGVWRNTSLETKRLLLEAMNSLAEVAKLKRAIVPPVKVFTQGGEYHIPVYDMAGADWQLIDEQGQYYAGKIEHNHELALPQALPLGYHQLTIQWRNMHWPCRVIIAPARCFQSSDLLQGKKLWGVTVQLYALRSANNWGVGDFSDLRQTIGAIAEKGGDFVGLNPIHALYPANPESASPYSPSSRSWLNIIYIDVNAVAEFQTSPVAQKWWQSALIREQLAKLRADEWVDYSGVSKLKLEALRMAFNQFIELDPNQVRRLKFKQFVELGGDSLRHQATFDALQAALNIAHSNLWGWPVWPAEYQHADDETVTEFYRNNHSEVAFYSWLQWLAAEQLAECDRESRRLGMAIGVYRDLAVGVELGGADTWQDRSLYCLKASIGAPPDPLGPLGQNWGLPPIDPHNLQLRLYEPFIQLLRDNMAHCGALRIDHVMSMLRLWWIPREQTSDRGAYVAYPVDDMLAILALESQRQRCVVIGEDLGTVPEEIVTKLFNRAIYSYRVLYFEHDGGNVFYPPNTYPVQAIATINTHDLSTLRSFWGGNDLALGSDLGLYPNREKLIQLYRERDRCKRGLLNALVQHGYLAQEALETTLTLPMTDELSLAIQRFIATSSSQLLGLQMEDWLGILLPVNVPGTSESYPNWRRKLTKPLEEIFSDTKIIDLLVDINQLRRDA